MALDRIEPKHEDIIDRNILLEDLKNFIEETQHQLKECNLMLGQSQSELNKLVQRNTSASTQLQQEIAQGEPAIPPGLKNSLSLVMETQQRMIMMRNQLEKVQGEQTLRSQTLDILQKVYTYLESGSSSSFVNRPAASMEMLIDAQESERQRLSKQMHDGPAQALSNFIVQAEIAARLLEMDPTKAKEELENLKVSAMSTFQKVRAFISELRPMMLDDLGLIPTLRRYIEGYKDQYNADVTLTVNGTEKRLEQFQEVVLFRAAQELMENASRHNIDNPSKVQVNLQLTVDQDFVKLVVSDNGIGFDPSSASQSTGLGLKLIRDRVEMLGGNINIDSSPGQGSSIGLQLPIINKLT